MPTIGGKYFALAVLFVMNTLNYVDRYAFFAVSSHIQRDLHIDDYWFGWLASAFMIVYTAVAPFTGWLGDRYNRKLLIFGGVGLWSFATVGAAFSGRLLSHVFLAGPAGNRRGQLRRDRAGACWPTCFRSSERGRAMGVYYLALPVGTALGFVLGGTIADALGWRAVFLVVGLPGLLAAFAALRHERSGPRRIGGRGHQGQDRATGPERLSRADQDQDICLQHAGHGGGDVCDRGLRRLGFRVLSARPRPDGGRGRPANRPRAGRSRLDRNRAGNVCSRPPLQVDQASLSAARRGRGPVLRSRWALSASSTDTPIRRSLTCSVRRSCCRWCWGLAIP